MPAIIIKVPRYGESKSSVESSTGNSSKSFCERSQDMGRDICVIGPKIEVVIFGPFGIVCQDLFYGGVDDEREKRSD